MGKPTLEDRFASKLADEVLRANHVRIQSNIHREESEGFILGNQLKNYWKERQRDN
jgi:hypothetical protein